MAAFRKQLTLFDDYREMLADPVRMRAYRRAITAVIRPTDVVIDLGAGTGILSLMAARAGAAHVYAIESSDAIELARRTAAANGLADKITFIRGMSRDVTLPARGHVLVSETLGSFGLEENTLEFTIDARERLLVPGARMIPHAIATFVAPVELASFRRKAEFWRNIDGFDFSPARDDLTRRMSVTMIQQQDIVAEPQPFSDHDLTTCQLGPVVDTMRFPILRRAVIDGFAGWFRADLSPGEDGDEIFIRTSPADQPTHWQQAFFPLREPVKVVRGDIIELTLRVAARSDHSDNSEISYDYRCTQLANERRQTERKPGRNDPCPCGSGRKFKRCCGG